MQRAAHFGAKPRALVLAPGVQERDAAGHVVEDQEGGGRHVVQQRQPFRPPAGGQPLEEADDVEACVADQAAGERHAGAFRLKAGRSAERGAKDREEFRACHRCRKLPAVERESVAVELEVERVAEADERIASEALAALDALEQEARPEGRELQVCRDRCVEIARQVEWWFHFPHAIKNPSRWKPETGSGIP